jgi:predicted nuclease with RNAse H fold
VIYAGVDVGARRKGFHAAAIDSRGLSAGPVRLPTVDDTTAWLVELQPRLVAVDSPISCAPDDERSRPCERALASTVCGIRYTPSCDVLASSRYYEWIEHGLELYVALATAGLRTVECFPTASFTRWAGPRGSRSRAAWTRGALGLDLRLNQDGRDAIAAAFTARASDLGQVEQFGEIAVPLGRTARSDLR